VGGQPAGLSLVLSETQGASVTRYVHSPRGIHAHKDASGNWAWMMQDGLGSVRGVVDDSLGVLWTGNPAPYGEYFSETGTRQSPYLFTGEYTDPITALVHLRARDYAPGLGVFASLDPFEGMADRPMSLNGYMYVEGNTPNATDASGNCIDYQIFATLLVLLWSGLGRQSSGTTDCEGFIAELRGITQNFIREINVPQPTLNLFGITLLSTKPVSLYSAETLRRAYAAILGQIYAGTPFTIPSGVPLIGGGPLLLRSGGGGQFERYGMPNKDDYPEPDAWRNPIFYRDQPAHSLRESYGFRRPYFGNTHHYFAFLKYAEELPGLTGSVNYERELRDGHQITLALGTAL
jgi:RHS repeat-associated protein